MKNATGYFRVILRLEPDSTAEKENHVAASTKRNAKILSAPHAHNIIVVFSRFSIFPLETECRQLRRRFRMATLFSANLFYFFFFIHSFLFLSYFITRKLAANITTPVAAAAERKRPLTRAPPPAAVGKLNFAACPRIQYTLYKYSMFCEFHVTLNVSIMFLYFRNSTDLAK